MTGRSRLRSALFATVTVILVLGTIEVVARIAWSSFAGEPKTPEPPVAWFVYAADIGWKPRPNYEGGVYWERRAYDDRGLLAGDYRPTVKHRIVTLGDSCTFGYGIATQETFSSLLESRLDSVDVVNISAPGYTSYQGLRSLDLALSLNPDLVVVAFGFNDRRYVVDDGSVDRPSHFRRVYWQQRMLRLRRYYYTYRSISYVVRKFRSTALDTIDLRSVPPRVEVEAYRENLNRIAERCQQRGVEVVFLVYGDNPDVAAPVSAGAALAAGGRFDDAIASYWQAIRFHFLELLARRHLAAVYTELNQPAMADSVALVPGGRSLHGGGIVRDQEPYHEAVFEVARARALHVVDMRPAFAKDTSVYVDVVHFDHRGHMMVADRLRRTIIEHELLKGTSR